MKYMLLTYANSDFDVESFAAEKGDWFKELVTFMHDLNDELKASGEFVVAEGLADAKDAWTVRPEGDDVVTTDGPFAETKEMLAGFWIVDVAGLKRAEEIAGRLVKFCQAPIEIRAVGQPPQV
ncbi:MAG: YciI family protein [Actinomycetota bacterium]|nr:YciI family protein [Actinomycetota bacterium]